MIYWWASRTLKADAREENVISPDDDVVCEAG
jgi:hypothetical protein